MSELVWFAALAVYLFPALIALVWKRPDYAFGIFWLNLLLGWTIVGWVAALCWAIAAPAIGVGVEPYAAKEPRFYKKSDG